ncbi:hypothetical protein DFH11DRAFT_453219 [Phellopilus nigrolimitatus]|nr:hypothetical protein DFH11DRAFT_453219 [Phellopilus nigrolimitatus]
MTNPTLDPYTQNAQNDDLTPQKKIDDMKVVLKAVKTGMLTTRDKDGNLHARAMTPCSPYADTQLTLVFLANNASHKFDALEYDNRVNVSFYDAASTNWVSFAGAATVSQDRELIKKHWSPITAGYFGNLGDGTHKGDEHDPRVSVIEVVPSEIHYWLAKHGKVTNTLSTAVGSVTGKGGAPGELRTITKPEIELTQGLHNK